MKTFKFFLFTLALLFCSSTRACECIIKHYTNEENYNTYDFIVSGTVTKVEQLKYAQLVFFSVNRNYKGNKITRVIQIRTGEAGVGCELYFKEGEKWLLYGFTRNNHLSVSNGSDSKALFKGGWKHNEEQIASELSYLETKQQPIN